MGPFSANPDPQRAAAGSPAAPVWTLAGDVSDTGDTAAEAAWRTVSAVTSCRWARAHRVHGPKRGIDTDVRGRSLASTEDGIEAFALTGEGIKVPRPGGIPESISSNNLLPHKPSYEVDKPHGNDPDGTRTVEMAITLMQDISFLLGRGDASARPNRGPSSGWTQNSSRGAARRRCLYWL